MFTQAAGTSSTYVMPWTTNEPRRLEQAVNALVSQADLQNRRWAQKWFESFQFVLGNHYLKWSRQYDFAIDTDFLRGDNDTRKRSQTNISRTVVESTAALIYSNLPDIYAAPLYDGSSRGTRLAKTIESLVETYNERLNLHEEFDAGSVMYVMYNKVFAAITYDMNRGATFKRQKQQLVNVPKMTTIRQTDPLTGEDVVVPTPMMGPDGQPVMIQSQQAIIDPNTGRPVLETVRNGDVRVEMLTPFEIQYDPLAKTFSKAKWVSRIRVMDYDDFMIEFASQEGVIERNMSRVTAGNLSSPVKNMAFRHFLRSVFALPPVLDFNGQLNLSNLFNLKNKILVVEYYDRPTEGHRYNPTPYLAQGRRCVMANGVLCLVSTPQYLMNNDTGWHPILEAKWLPLPPSQHATGPMSDTVQKNRELNLTDTMMTLAIQRQAGSTLVINENSGIDKTKWSGEPGQTFYTSGDPQAAATYIADKSPLPALVQQYRALQKEDVYEVSAAQDSIRGERSVGANSGYQAQIYEEREKKRTSKASNNWESFIRQIYQKMIACLQQNVAKLDEQVIARMMRSMDGEITVSDIISFLNGPIDFGVDIKITPDSMQTKSKATKIANMVEAMNNPAVAQRMMQDSSVVDAYLDFLGIDVLRSVSSSHRDRANRENAVFSDMISFIDPNQLVQAFGDDMPTVIWQDDDLVHLLEHTRDLVKNFDKYKRNPGLLRAHSVHMTWHEQNYKAKQNQQSPYLASQSQMIEQNAEQIAAAPKDFMTELTKWRQQQILMQQLAEQQAAAAPAAAAPAAAPPEQQQGAAQ